MCPACGRVIGPHSLLKQPHYGRLSLPAFFQGHRCPKWPNRRVKKMGTGSRPTDAHPEGTGSHDLPRLGWLLAPSFPACSAGTLGRGRVPGAYELSLLATSCAQIMWDERSHPPDQPAHPGSQTHSNPGTGAARVPGQAGLHLDCHPNNHPPPSLQKQHHK